MFSGAMTEAESTGGVEADRGVERSAPQAGPQAGPDPVSAYLAGLDNLKTRSTMRSALDTAAAELGVAGAQAIRWPMLRDADVRAMRVRLGQRRSPGTVNKVLSAIRGVAREAMRLGQLDAGEYAKIAEIGGVRGTRRAERPIVRSRSLAPQEPARALVEDTALLARGLRQPAHVIALHARVIERGEDSGPAARAAAREISGAARRLSRMIEDLLDLSRMDLRDLPLRSARVDLGALALEAAADLRLAAPELLVEAEAAAGCEVIGDADRLAQALAAVLGSAGDHGARVRVSVAREDPEVVVTVRSEGAVEAQEAVEAMFDRAAPAPEGEDAATQRAGLYLARERIEAHGGRLAATSVGGARTVVLKLPPAR